MITDVIVVVVIIATAAFLLSMNTKITLTMHGVTCTADTPRPYNVDLAPTSCC